ncbi:NADPH oxidase B [Marasmius fiardii PR-910]|nr:NADPH oxidase B [Marasmius fiardii PR-910]
MQYPTTILKSTRQSLDLDFSDKHKDGNPDLYTIQPHLKRNHTERRRLQTLQRRLTRELDVSTNIQAGPAQSKLFQTFRNKVNLWSINEGGRQLFFAVWILLHLLVATFGYLNYLLKDDLTNARRVLGRSYVAARTSALVLHIDVVFILLPICRNFISLLRQTPLNHIIPFDKNITFHKATGWSIVIWSTVHIISHLINFAILASRTADTVGGRLVEFLNLNFTTGPGITGWIMTSILCAITWFSTERQRKKRFEWFWYTHHLFIVFFVNWQLHGMFCMIKPDRPPSCSWFNIGVFWKYWILGGAIWVYERILREVRSRHITHISKVIQHPSNVMELQIKKEKTTARAGQYIFLSCPEVSYFQWHPFTLTSAPEEDYLSVHIRVVGDFTLALANSVGCDFRQDSQVGRKLAGRQVVFEDELRINPVLPRVMIDGPFGGASEDFMNFETVLLVGAGIGVTPYASILKSMWYRMNGFNYSKSTRLSKVYFTWVIRDYGQAEWFHSLLQAIEEQDVLRRIEISIYLTGNMKEDEINNIMVHDVGAEKDTITSLRAPTHFGRPNWTKVFENVVERHPGTDVGVFFCGPQALSRELHTMSNKHSNPSFGGTRFFYKKGEKADREHYPLGP